MSTLSPAAGDVLAALENADRILVQQVFRPIGNEYRISIPAPGSSEEGRPLLFVKQKKLAIKEDIRFRLDPDREDHLFMIKARTVFEFGGRYEVHDANGQPIGTLAKSFAKSLLRSHWTVQDALGQEVFDAEEKSLAIALLRRFGDLIPYVGVLLTYVPFDFVLRSAGGGELAHYRRVLGKLRDRYVLELSPEAGSLDRRLLIAFAVGLDALQDR
jgi:uncharacterized protein YxjI